MRLKNKIAVIPGGTAGIGKEIALGYAKEGAVVIVCSRGDEHVNAMTGIIKKSGYEGLSLKVDITKKEEVDAMIDRVVKEYGRVDIMLNSVGFYPATPFLQISREEWHRVMDINLNGSFYCAQAAAHVMVKQRSGRIIFITSGQALHGVALMAHYSASKGALVSFTRALAAELSPLGINVNAIAAGLTTTDMVNNAIPEEYLKIAAQKMAVRRLARPDEYVGIAVLLGSDDGGYITGETIAVDGGHSNVAS
ncbi:MAG: SDR family oxidoreductase [Syntrophales bacterium]|jgi:NAD(P)-dependent dehydrogenase (short-subunit alcohol dehydrogenase family)